MMIPLTEGRDCSQAGALLNGTGARVQSPVLIDPDSRRREFDRKTVGLVVDQFRRGVLPEAILLALLAGVGLEVGDE